MPGVDSIWTGFPDLSNFLGVPGETHHPTDLAALDRIVAAAEKHNRPLGTAAGNEAQAREALARGFSRISFGTDVFLLQSALSQHIAAMREAK